jgi:glycosyltransferase involved in cell wall biosynthesis
LGHEIYIYPANRWRSSFAELPAGVQNKLVIPDIIYCGDHWDILRALLLKYGLNRKIPIFNVLWWFPSKSPLYYFANNISVCNYEREYLKNLLGIDSPVIYCPVNTNLFRPVKKWKNRKIATIIGNYFKERPIMGYDYLLKIFKRVHELDPEIRFRVIGYNPNLLCPPHVEKMFLKREEMPKYINESSCVFFTTTRNLIPHSLLISMSCGKNVIAFNLPPLREVIIDGVTGHLISPFNVEMFAQKIVEVANNPLRKIGERARKVVLHKCERMMIAKQFIEVFEKEQGYFWHNIRMALLFRFTRSAKVFPI